MKFGQGLREVDAVIHAAILQITLIDEQKKLGYELNLLGTHNVCKIVNETPSLKGIILTDMWHVFGERMLKGTIDEEFGFRPDKVVDRAYKTEDRSNRQEVASFSYPRRHQEGTSRQS